MPLSSFLIERSTDGGKSWSIITEKPYVSFIPESGNQDQINEPSDEELQAMNPYELDLELMRNFNVFNDSVVDLQLYSYRVCGYDAFGELSNYSNRVDIELKDITPPSIPIILGSTTLNDSIAIIKFTKNQFEDDFHSYLIEFSPGVSNNWKVISDKISPTDSIYIDVEASKRGTGYYRVSAWDNMGNGSYSFDQLVVFHDYTPPQVPKGLIGFVSADGIAMLTWNSVPDIDLEGYKVYWANDSTHQFLPKRWDINQDTLFLDTLALGSLTNYIYYKVSAVDVKGNESALTPIIQLRKPDLTPPSVSSLLDTRNNADSVFISWTKSGSSDAALYRIYRKPENKTEWTLVKELEAHEIDDTIEFCDAPGIGSWNYAIEVIDESGLLSEPSSIVPCRIYGKVVQEIPINITGKYNEKEKQVELKWSTNYDKEFYYDLYRKVGNDTEFRIVQKFGKRSKEYTDFTAQPGETAEYYIQMMLENGRRSEPSEVIVIVVPKKVKK